MIGQTKLLEQFNTIKSLPHSIILSGKIGSGRHMFSQYLADKFNLTYIDINKIDDETLDSFAASTIPYLCVIEQHKITWQTSSKILKFLEEPMPNIYTIIICDTAINLSEAIINRCYKIQMQEYSIEDLSKFIINSSNIELTCKVFNTPGQLLNYSAQPILLLLNTADNLLKSSKTISVNNIFNIVDKLNFETNDYDGSHFIAESFFIALKFVAADHVIKNENNAIVKYQLTNAFFKNLEQFSNKKQAFENYLFKLKQLS